jgi:hypothetical protein
LEVLDEDIGHVFHGSALVAPHFSLFDGIDVLELFTVGDKTVIVVESW